MKDDIFDELYTRYKCQFATIQSIQRIAPSLDRHCPFSSY